MTAILQTRPLVSAPDPEVSKLERFLRRKTFEIEILQDALDVARVKYAMGSAPASVPEIVGRNEAPRINWRKTP
jgi:hypothetical protein